MAKINCETVSRTLPARKVLTLCGLIALIALAGCAGMLGGEQGTPTASPTTETDTGQSNPTELNVEHPVGESYTYVQTRAETDRELTYNWTVSNVTSERALITVTTPDWMQRAAVNQTSVGNETAAKVSSVFSTLYQGVELAEGGSLDPGSTWTASLPRGNNSVDVPMEAVENKTVNGIACTEIVLKPPVDNADNLRWCIAPSEHPFALEFKDGNSQIQLTDYNSGN